MPQQPQYDLLGRRDISGESDDGPMAATIFVNFINTFLTYKLPISPEISPYGHPSEVFFVLFKL